MGKQVLELELMDIIMELIGHIQSLSQRRF
nr:MAG TPA: hypothetical protein [Caudoviricetes sp.]